MSTAAFELRRDSGGGGMLMFCPRYVEFPIRCRAMV